MIDPERAAQIREQVITRAAAGDMRAVRLIVDGTLDRLDQTADAAAHPIEEHVAAAMLAAANHAGDIGPERTAEWLETLQCRV